MNSDVLMRRTGCAVAATLLSSLYCAVPVGCSQKAERAIDARLVPVMDTDPREDPPAQQFWPGWRGVNTCGISEERDLPVEWNTASNLRWRVSVPGGGNSSPVVCGNHVLLTSAMGDGEGSELVVWSFDRRNGARRWQATAGTVQGATHPKNGHASASVATNGKQVFASFGNAGLFAFDLSSSQQLWRADLGTLEHKWGFASSPVLAGELVIQLADSETGSSIMAFHQATGQPVWHTERPGRGSWSTPVLVEATMADGQTRTELVVNGTGADRSGRGLVIAYDPTTGRELWRVQGTTDIVCPTAIAGGNLVISTSGRNGPILAIKPGGQGNVTATNVVWKHPRGGAYVPTGVAYRNRLFTVNDGGIACCFHLENGEAVWRDRRLKGSFTASLIAGDGHVYAVSEQGDVYVIAASDKFNLVATNDMQQRILATPAIAAGDLFIRSEDALCCIAGKSDLAQEDSLENDAATPADVTAQASAKKSTSEIETDPAP